MRNENHKGIVDMKYKRSRKRLKRKSKVEYFAYFPYLIPSISKDADYEKLLLRERQYHIDDGFHILVALWPHILFKFLA